MKQVIFGEIFHPNSFDSYPSAPSKSSVKAVPRNLESVIDSDLPKVPLCTSVDVVAADDVITRLQQAAQGRRLSPGQKQRRARNRLLHLGHDFVRPSLEISAIYASMQYIRSANYSVREMWENNPKGHSPAWLLYKAE